jgi:hypothetical protein
MSKDGVCKDFSVEAIPKGWINKTKYEAVKAANHSLRSQLV